MARMVFAFVDAGGTIGFDRSPPAGVELLGCGFSAKLRRSVRAKADRDGAGSLRLPGFASAPGDAVDRFRRRIARATTPVPERWSERTRPAEPVAVEVPLWRTLLAIDAPAALAVLARTIGATVTAVETRVARWLAAGLVERVGAQPYLYQLAADAPRSGTPPQVDAKGRTRPRTSTARGKLWRAMRVLGRFDLPTLEISSGASRRSAEDLINCLHRGGYLRQLRRGNATSGEWSTYALIRNTGPIAPSIVHGKRPDGSRFRELVDGNTGERTDIAPGAASLRKAKADLGDGGVG